jgi:murein endopeptidase
MVRSMCRRLVLPLVGVAALLLGASAAVWATGESPSSAPPPTAVTAPAPPLTAPEPALPDPPYRRVRWRRSRSVGLPFSGRLVEGVRLPFEGRDFFTWDPVRKRSPNRSWRRWGHSRLVRVLLSVLREHRSAFPDAPRVGVGDISRPRGGDFGPRFGSIGHASHQNGLDADVYYPRLDRLEERAKQVGQIDIELAQDLVDRFVRAGAEHVFVGPSTGLTGPSKVVETLPNHDDHLHVRIRARPGGR